MKIHFYLPNIRILKLMQMKTHNTIKSNEKIISTYNIFINYNNKF